VAWRIHGPTWRPTASHGAAANHTDPARGGAGDAGAVNVSGLSRRLFRKGRMDQQVRRWCRRRDLPRRSPISRYAPNQTDCQPSRLSEATRCLPPKFTASG
jgi:hypothetical protein